MSHLKKMKSLIIFSLCCHTGLYWCIVTSSLMIPLKIEGLRNIKCVPHRCQWRYHCRTIWSVSPGRFASGLAFDMQAMCAVLNHTVALPKFAWLSISGYAVQICWIKVHLGCEDDVSQSFYFSRHTIDSSRFKAETTVSVRAFCSSVWHWGNNYSVIDCLLAVVGLQSLQLYAGYNLSKWHMASWLWKQRIGMQCLGVGISNSDLLRLNSAVGVNSRATARDWSLERFERTGTHLQDYSVVNPLNPEVTQWGDFEVALQQEAQKILELWLWAGDINTKTD